MATTESPVAAAIMATDPLAMLSARDKVAIEIAAALLGSNPQIPPTDLAHRAYTYGDALVAASSLAPSALTYHECDGRLERRKPEQPTEAAPGTSAEHSTTVLSR